MPVSLESENDILHEDAEARVTPSWLTVGGSSYAIRTIVRLDIKAHKPPTGLATCVFVCALVLICICLWYLFRDTVPAPLAWVLLVASTLLMLYAAWYAFAVKTHYEVLVSLINGSPILLRRSRQQDAESLYQGLTEAMDWHVGGDIVINADSRDSAARGERSSNLKHHASTKSESASAAERRSLSHVLPFLSILYHKSRR
ncbi:MAG: DUF6232 family protein [Granulosicoccus sp.]